METSEVKTMPPAEMRGYIIDVGISVEERRITKKFVAPFAAPQSRARYQWRFNVGMMLSLSFISERIIRDTNTKESAIIINSDEPVLYDLAYPF